MGKFLLAVLILTVSIADAATETTSERRVEQEKRETLKSTELKAPSGITTPPPAAKNKIDDLQVSYLGTLPGRKVLLRHDLCQVIGIIAGQKDFEINERIKWMNERGLIPPELKKNFDPMQPLTKGVAAYSFCKLLKIKGGIMIRTFGLSQRYAVRELSYLRMMQGSSSETMSGQELIILVMKATDYMMKQKTAK